MIAIPSTTSVSLTWDTVAGASSYKVYRDGVLVGSPSTNSYNDTSLTEETEYEYQITAINLFGESAKTAVTTVTTTSE